MARAFIVINKVTLELQPSPLITILLDQETSYQTFVGMYRIQKVDRGSHDERGGIKHDHDNGTSRAILRCRGGSKKNRAFRDRKKRWSRSWSTDVVMSD